MKKYAFVIYYGTLSARALLVDLETGEEAADAVYNYPHAVMDTVFLNGTALPADFALQHPQDYIEALTHVITRAMEKASVTAEQIQCIGLDFTSCTILPVFKDGLPLCYDEAFSNNPHAYVKLWKHHAAQPYADTINELARESKWISRYGGKVSSEWLLPKIMEILEKAPEVYERADRFIEAGDWLIWQLTGSETHNVSMAGFKGLWHSDDGYMSNEFLKKLHPKLDGLLGTKVSKEMLPMHSLAGYLTKDMAHKLRLKEGTPVAACNIDAHSSVPAAGIASGGELLMIMGTSTCHIFMSEAERMVSGICGVVKNGILDGYYAYEAGQACVGDSFNWFIKNMVPADYHKEAAERNISVFALLDEKAAGLKPGESGLLALDWWNGNRSTLSNSELTGMILGLNLRTKPEEIYRALIEATAFGSRMIVESLTETGIPIDTLYATGGLANKNPMLMQIYADVLNREIKLVASPQACALGAAMSGAVASGYFENMADCAARLAKVKEDTYRPIGANHEKYDMLYHEYKKLYQYFGKENDVMKKLKAL